MLLPSDVARLVLGYLQQEGLIATSRAFILESPNLREYAEHGSEDGVIPACVFSLFGKNLTTILNEYFTEKAKETCQENQIPAVMTSLCKKLAFTLNQIKSMQNSPAVQHIQRLRILNSIQNRCQRVLSSSQTLVTGCLSVSSPGNCVPRHIPNPQGILGHSTPVCYTSQQTRPSTISLSQSEETPLQIMVPDHRFTPGPLSPARRKCDSPRRRGGQIGINRGVTVTSLLTVESQNQEAVTENLSQMVIENARDKILNDRSLQEKLAENINKILASDNSPQTLRAVCNTMEQEQSIDEILGLQGEIHMTDDAIQDILEQTESDPAFQALFDLFENGKNKMAECGENADRSNSAQESDEPNHMDTATDTGTGQEDSTSGGETTTRILRSKRKPAVILSTGKPVPKASSHAQSRAITKQTANPKGAAQNKKGSSRSRGSASKKHTRGMSSTLKEQLNNKAQDKSSSSDPSVSSCSLSEEGASMEVDDPTSVMSQVCSTKEMPKQVPQELAQTSTRSNNAPVSTKQPEPTLITGADLSGNACEAGEIEQTQQVAKAPESVSEQPVTDKDSLLNTVMQDKESTSNMTSSPASIFLEPLTSLVSVPTCATTTTPSTSTVLSPSQSPTTESDPDKMVALKIIVSDEQEHQGCDSALNQAVSSISSDRIPTIFLSPPAKSVPKVLPSTPGSPITPEETAAAVSSLQGAESPADPVVSLQPPQARPVAPETAFIQLLPANASFGGTSSYFVMADPSSRVDQHSRMLLLPGAAGEKGVCSTPHVVATPPRPRAVVSIAPNVAQSFSPASTIIISSPVQPMVQNMAVPMSVFGQNSTGQFTVVPSQMLTLPGPKLVSQSARVVVKPRLVSKDNVELGKIGTPTGESNQVSKVSQNSEQINTTTGASPSHRRILCFDENTNQTSTNPAAASPLMKESTRTERAHPVSLGNNHAKKRVETIRLSDPSQGKGTPETVTSTEPQQEKEATESTQTEARTDQTVNSSTSLNNSVQQNLSGRLESKNMGGDSAAFSNPAHSLNSSTQKPESISIIKGNSEEETNEQTPVKAPEGPSTSNVTQNSSNIAANKENEVEDSWQEPNETATLILPTVRPATPAAEGGVVKPTSKTSPLTKQAVEMLQDIQGQSPISTTPSRRGAIELLLPKTPVPGRLPEDLLEVLRTPKRQRHGREGEDTPKHLAPPATPDLPSCSPASEAGSENSINMAAHTLMILSRAARRGAPLKDSLRQEEAGAAKSSSSKAKKRKHAEPSPPAKKELHLTSSSGIKKKAKKQKKLLDSFPHDLDVDKFLSSLHYDE